MRKIAVTFAVSAAMAALQCEGTNTGNPRGPLASFTGSDCQNDRIQSRPTTSSARAVANGTTAIGTAREALNDDGGTGALDSNPDDFAALECVAWNLREDSTLELNYWNARGGCGATWVGGSARFEGGKLHLNAYQRGCEAAQCGTCVYDFHFEVRDVPDGDTTVSLDYTDENEKRCGDAGSVVIVSLPTSRERSGALCSPLGQVGFVTPHCSRNAPCGDMVMGDLGQPASCPTCEGGDLCAPLGDGLGNACLKPCTTDADCDNPAMGCHDGGCAIVAPLRSP